MKIHWANAFVPSGKVSQQGECPQCGGRDLSYGTLTPSDTQVYYPWECENCGVTGQEWYNIEFSGHNIKE